MDHCHICSSSKCKESMFIILLLSFIQYHGITLSFLFVTALWAQGLYTLLLLDILSTVIWLWTILFKLCCPQGPLLMWQWLSSHLWFKTVTKLFIDIPALSLFYVLSHIIEDDCVFVLTMTHLCHYTLLGVHYYMIVIVVFFSSCHCNYLYCFRSILLFFNASSLPLSSLTESTVF